MNLDILVKVRIHAGLESFRRLQSIVEKPFSIMVKFSFLFFQRSYRRHRDGTTAQGLGQAWVHPGYRGLASHVLFPQYLPVGFSAP